MRPSSGSLSKSPRAYTSAMPIAGQHAGEADAEGDDQREAEGDAMQRDGAQHHDERRRAGQQSARDAEGEQAAQRDRRVRRRQMRVAVGVVVTVVVLVPVMMIVRMVVSVVVPSCMRVVVVVIVRARGDQARRHQRRADARPPAARRPR